MLYCVNIFTLIVRFCSMNFATAEIYAWKARVSYLS